MAKKMHKDPEMSIDDICKTLKTSKPSFYRYLSLSKNIDTENVLINEKK